MTNEPITALGVVCEPYGPREPGHTTMWKGDRGGVEVLVVHIADLASTGPAWTVHASTPYLYGPVALSSIARPTFDVAEAEARATIAEWSPRMLALLGLEARS